MEYSGKVFHSPSHPEGVPIIVTEDGYTFYWVGGVWVDNLDPSLVDMTLDAGPPDAQPVVDTPERLYSDVLSRCQEYGRTTSHSEELIGLLIESLAVEEEEDDEDTAEEGPGADGSGPEGLRPQE